MTITTDSIVRQQVRVAVPVERAFAIFTEQFDKIKPRDHNLLNSPIVESVFEPRVGGRVYDRGQDGSICAWARVLAFEPPHRFVISWDINPQWHVESDPDHCSEVEVRFTADDGGTRVDLEHRHLERHGDGWQRERDAIAGPNGWPIYLQGFTAATEDTGPNSAEDSSILPADFLLARGAVDRIVHGVGTDSWTVPTPCPAWTASDLVGHLVDGQNLLRRLADGRPWSTDADPGHLAGDDPAAAWDAAVAQFDRRVDQAALGVMVATPTGEAQLGEFLDRRVSMELLVHAWDLAHATGQHVDIDPALPRRIHAAIAPLDEHIRGPRRYGPRQQTTSNDELDQLVAFLGRTV